MRKRTSNEFIDFIKYARMYIRDEFKDGITAGFYESDFIFAIFKNNVLVRKFYVTSMRIAQIQRIKKSYELSRSNDNRKKR